MARAHHGDQSVLPELERLLDANPSIWQKCYNLTSVVEQAWLDKVAGPNLLLSQSIRRHLEQMKRDLAGPDPSPLERVLVERIAASWLGVECAELAVAGASGDGTKVTDLRRRQLDSANKRFLAATKALALARRLQHGLRIEISHHHGEAPAESKQGSRPDAPPLPPTAPDRSLLDAGAADPTTADPLPDRLRGLLRDGIATETSLTAAATGA